MIQAIIVGMIPNIEVSYIIARYISCLLRGMINVLLGVKDESF